MSNPIIVEQFIEASPEKVWQALTDKEQMKEWYFDMADFELEEGAVFN
ncbi:MAG TPA: SRPBCC domain-containing protein, partial [Chitinophagaceae bacterium]